MPSFPLSVLKVHDVSMEPALKHGDYIIVNRWAKNLSNGDIVVFSHENMVLVKRIGKKDGSGFFVLGDNADNSLDSRKLGAIDRKQVIGKVVLKI